MVSDNGVPELSSTTRVVITVEDINDHSPEFDQKLYKVQISSNAIIDQPLFQVSLSPSRIHTSSSISILSPRHPRPHPIILTFTVYHVSQALWLFQCTNLYRCTPIHPYTSILTQFFFSLRREYIYSWFNRGFVFLIYYPNNWLNHATPALVRIAALANSTAASNIKMARPNTAITFDHHPVTCPQHMLA